MKDTSTILRSQRDALRNLPPEQFKVAMLAIMDYEMDEIESTDDPIAAFALGMAKPLIDKRERRGAAGRENATKRWKKNAKECEPMQTDAKVVQTDANGMQKEAKKTGKKFIPPTPDDVRKYIAENGYSVDADKFVDFYESKGWMVGKNKMKDWKAAVRTWARGGKTAKSTNKFNNFQSSGTDWDAVADQLWENG